MITSSANHSVTRTQLFSRQLRSPITENTFRISLLWKIAFQMILWSRFWQITNLPLNKFDKKKSTTQFSSKIVMMFRQAVRPSLRRIVLFVVCVVILCENANAIFDYPPPNESAPDEGITCQRLGMLNQTKILCHTRTKVENLDKIRKSQEKTKDGRVCTKIFNLVQR